MPNYKLTEAAWLERETAKVRYFLTEHLQRNREYSAADLLYMLRQADTFYTNPEYLPIGQALIAEGLIEAV